ncbi:MAG: PDZ domain-containing protein [Pirellula sp.]
MPSHTSLYANPSIRPWQGDDRSSGLRDEGQGFSALGAADWEQLQEAYGELESSMLVQQGGAVLGRPSRNSAQRAFQRGSVAALKAYREAIGDSWKATVQILADNRQLALGAIVRENGWIATKASEIPESPVDVRLADGTRAEGLVKIRRPDLDLALLKIERSDLPTIQWNPNTEVPLGGWLASADMRSLPLALGVVSVRKLSVRQERAVLGVQLSTAHDSAYVENVVSGSGAERAGIRSGDIIREIDKKELPSRREVLESLMSIPAGHRVHLGIEREGKRVQLAAQMMDLSNSLLDPTEMEVNGSISARSTGFNHVIQHDTVLSPDHCGGPLIDVDGNVVGMNIARAGRVCSYAIPAQLVSRAVEEMLETVSQQSHGALTSVPTLTPELATDANPRIGSPSTLANPPSVSVESLKPGIVSPPAPEYKPNR